MQNKFGNTREVSKITLDKVKSWEDLNAVTLEEGNEIYENIKNSLMDESKRIKNEVEAKKVIRTKVVMWKPDKGFGFVVVDGERAFIHINSIRPVQLRGLDLTGIELIIKHTKNDSKGMIIVEALTVEENDRVEKKQQEHQIKIQELEQSREVGKFKLEEHFSQIEALINEVPLPARPTAEGKNIDISEIEGFNYSVNPPQKINFQTEFDQDGAPIMDYRQSFYVRFGNSYSRRIDRTSSFRGWENFKYLGVPVQNRTGVDKKIYCEFDCLQEIQKNYHFDSRFYAQCDVVDSLPPYIRFGDIHSENPKYAKTAEALSKLRIKIPTSQDLVVATEPIIKAWVDRMFEYPEIFVGDPDQYKKIRAELMEWRLNQLGVSENLPDVEVGEMLGRYEIRESDYGVYAKKESRRTDRGPGYTVVGHKEAPTLRIWINLPESAGFAFPGVSSSHKNGIGRKIEGDKAEIKKLSMSMREETTKTLEKWSQKIEWDDDTIIRFADKLIKKVSKKFDEYDATLK